jgi:hypothetical protein
MASVEAIHVKDLRRFFEVDKECIVIGTLYALSIKRAG